MQTLLFFQVSIFESPIIIGFHLHLSYPISPKGKKASLSKGTLGGTGKSCAKSSALCAGAHSASSRRSARQTAGTLPCHGSAVAGQLLGGVRKSYLHIIYHIIIYHIHHIHHHISHTSHTSSYITYIDTYSHTQLFFKRKWKVLDHVGGFPQHVFCQKNA